MADILLYFFILLAGLLSFLSPCVLPLVPPYLCYLGGVTFDELSQGEAELSPKAHGRIVLASLLFVFGFTLIFVSLGASASAFGQVLRGHQILLTQIAGVIIIIFGLQFLGLFRVSFLQRDTRFQSSLDAGSLVGAFLMGLAFAFGWTPCIGPILAPVLSLAMDTDTLGQAVGMLFVYSLGLGIPFVLAAVGIRPFLRFLKRFQSHLGLLEKILGLLLVLVGLLFINSTIEWAYSWISLNGFSTWLLENFEWLQSVEKWLLPDDVVDKINEKALQNR